MNYEVLFSPAVLFIFVQFVIVVVLMAIGLVVYWGDKSSAVYIAGTVLIVVAAVGVFCIEEIKGYALKLVGEGKLSREFYLTTEKRFNILLYILPFVSAAIGSNLISNELTKKKAETRST